MTEIEDASPAPARIGPAVLIYLVALLGALYVWQTRHPEGIWLAFTIAVPIAAVAYLGRQAWLRRRQGSCRSPAARAYQRRFLPMMVAYFFLLSGALWAMDTYHPAGPLAYLLAVLPALPLVGVVWALARLLVEEQDEYLRMLHARQMLVATAVALIATTIWGFLDQFGLVPHAAMYWTFVIWCGGLGVGSLINERRA